VASRPDPSVTGRGQQHDEWTEMRRYIGLDILARSRAGITTASTTKEVTLTAITA
jgi:putative transposase